jgi:hypothetical protein
MQQIRINQPKLSGVECAKQPLDLAWQELIQQAWIEREGVAFA